MLKVSRLLLAGSFLFVAASFTKPIIKTIQQANHPPEVKLVNPKADSQFDLNAQVNYEISVADKEDGSSKFDELNPKEVLLEVRYISSKAKMPVVDKTVPPDPAGLALIRTSNCFNCHNFNVKAIGPSFYDFTKKYPATPANVDSLMKHIRMGSAGIWGKVSMPTHPELSVTETKSIVQWILKNSADPAKSYYIGTEGTFRVQPPAGLTGKGAYVLTASYTDHGLKDTAGTRLKGQDVVVIYNK